MNPWSRTALTVLALALPLACAGSRGDAELVRDRVALPGSIRRIALVPTSFPDGLAGAPALGRRLERAALAALQRGGFRVLPAAVAGAIRERMIQEMGGLRDPESGEPDAHRAEVLEEYSTRELLTDHGPDALLRLALVPQSVPIAQGRLDWDGPEKDLCGRGEFVERMRCRRALGLGSVPGLMLRVWLEPRYAPAVYAESVGVQLMVEVGTEGALRPLPPSLMRVRPEALIRALTRALTPLIGS